MNKTNVYQASYDDLSELTINSMDMRSAVQGLKLVKEEEPQLLRRIMGNVITPNNTEVKVVAQSTSMQPLPEGIVVVPTEGVFYENDVVTLYEVPVDRATFVGWYEDDKLLSSDPIFNYVIPGKNVTVVAKFDVEPLADVTVTVDAVLAEGSTETLDGIYVRPYPTYTGKEGDKVWMYVIQDDSSTATFLGWFSDETLVSSEPSFEYTLPDEDVMLVAKFE